MSDRLHSFVPHIGSKLPLPSIATLRSTKRSALYLGRLIFHTSLLSPSMVLVFLHRSRICKFSFSPSISHTNSSGSHALFRSPTACGGYARTYDSSLDICRHVQKQVFVDQSNPLRSSELRDMFVRSVHFTE